jgi:hypothetical protein
LFFISRSSGCSRLPPMRSGHGRGQHVDDHQVQQRETIGL